MQIYKILKGENFCAVVGLGDRQKHRIWGGSGFIQVKLSKVITGTLPFSLPKKKIFKVFVAYILFKIFSFCWHSKNNVSGNVESKMYVTKYSNYYLLNCFINAI